MYKTWTSKSPHSCQILPCPTWIWKAAGRKQWMTWKVCEERTIINWVTEIRQYGYNGYLSNVVVHKILHLKCQPLNPYFFHLRLLFTHTCKCTPLMHHISISVQALTPYLNLCPLPALISWLVTLTMPTHYWTINSQHYRLSYSHSVF